MPQTDTRNAIVQLKDFLEDITYPTKPASLFGVLVFYFKKIKKKTRNLDFYKDNDLKFIRFIVSKKTVNT